MVVAQVDPFLLPIPKSLLKDAETRAYFEYMSRFLHDLWVRSGAGEDFVADQSVRENYPWERVEDLEPSSSISEFALFSGSDEDSRSYRAVTVASDYEAVSYDFISATRGATVRMPLHPEENSIVIIRNGDGSNIKLSGNGRNMNGSLTGNLRAEGTAIHFHYFIKDNEWFAR